MIELSLGVCFRQLAESRTSSFIICMCNVLAVGCSCSHKMLMHEWGNLQLLSEIHINSFNTQLCFKYMCYLIFPIILLINWWNCNVHLEAEQVLWIRRKPFGRNLDCFSYPSQLNSLQNWNRKFKYFNVNNLVYCRVYSDLWHQPPPQQHALLTSGIVNLQTS